jgi:hypothetical protein
LSLYRRSSLILSGLSLYRRSSLYAQRIVALSSFVMRCSACQSHSFRSTQIHDNVLHLTSIHLRVWLQYLKWWGGGQASPLLSIHTISAQCAAPGLGYTCLCSGPPQSRPARGGQNKRYYNGLYAAKLEGRTSQRSVAFAFMVCVCVCGFAAAPASESLSHAWYVFEFQRVVALNLMVSDCSFAGVPASHSLSHAWCVCGFHEFQRVVAFAFMGCGCGVQKFLREIAFALTVLRGLSLYRR